MKHLFRYVMCAILFLSANIVQSAEKKAVAKNKVQKAVKESSEFPTIKKDPYISAIVIDVATGKTLFEDNADAVVYPASTIKMLDLIVLLDKIRAGQLRLDDKITVTAEVAGIGGSDVYLKEGEIFPVEEMIYAMAVQSANDAAVALANHVAGSKDGFVKLMRERALQIGMTNTVVNSVHGLPPDLKIGQKPDVTTARDMSKLALEFVSKYPEGLKYTSTKQRPFRTQPLFNLQNHNKLLWSLNGCDGLKTGYIKKSGYSILATAERNNRRVVAVVMGSETVYGRVRDQKTIELINNAFANLPALPPPPAVTNDLASITKAEQEKANADSCMGLQKKTWKKVIIGGGILMIIIIAGILIARRSRQDTEFPM